MPQYPPVEAVLLLLSASLKQLPPDEDGITTVQVRSADDVKSGRVLNLSQDDEDGVTILTARLIPKDIAEQMQADAQATAAENGKTVVRSPGHFAVLSPEDAEDDEGPADMLSAMVAAMRAATPEQRETMHQVLHLVHAQLGFDDSDEAPAPEPKKARVH
jgi:hypothetical protein